MYRQFTVGCLRWNYNNNDNNHNNNNNNNNNNNIPVVQYSFCIIDWKISELKKIDSKTRKHKTLHPKAEVERLYITRKDRGRGLIDVETAFKRATIGLDHYLKHKEGQFSKAGA